MYRFTPKVDGNTNGPPILIPAESTNEALDIVKRDHPEVRGVLSIDLFEVTYSPTFRASRVEG